MNDWKNSLIEYFVSGAKRNLTPMLGVEIEHFILNAESRTAIPYYGEEGIRQILIDLMKYYPEAKNIPDDDFFGFSVPDFTVTLEPAAQLEISISPTDSVREIGEVYKKFSYNLNAVLSEYGYAAYNLGCQPISKVKETEMIPKQRYELMDVYFQNFGSGGIEMMRGTASVQVSVDYSSEDDFRRKLQAVHYYSPILKLLCDNASSFQGKALHTYLKRTEIWRRVDRSRCGILPNVFSDYYGFGNYADFLGAMPPIFLKRNNRIEPTGSRTVAELFEDKDMSEEDIVHILSMAFPEVRLKNFLEIRLADSIPLPFVSAYCALIKGLLYSAEGLEYAAQRIKDGKISETDVRKAEDVLMKQGWNTVVYGSTAKEQAKTLLALAQRGLPQNEYIYLDTFEAAIMYEGISNIPTEIFHRLLKKNETAKEQGQ